MALSLAEATKQSKENENVKNVVKNIVERKEKKAKANTRPTSKKDCTINVRTNSEVWNDFKYCASQNGTNASTLLNTFIYSYTKEKMKELNRKKEKWSSGRYGVYLPVNLF